MAAGAHSHADDHRVLEVQQLCQRGGQHRAGDAGDDDAHRRHALQAAALLAEGHRNGGGHAAGQQAVQQAVLQHEQLAQPVNQRHIGQAAHQAAQHHR